MLNTFCVPVTKIKLTINNVYLVLLIFIVTLVPSFTYVTLVPSFTYVKLGTRVTIKIKSTKYF